MTIDKMRRQELTLYIVLWVVTLASPLIGHCIEVLQGSLSPDLSVVCNAWLGLLVFFVVFWLHDLWVAPCLLQPHRHRDYAIRLVLVLSLFLAMQHFVVQLDKDTPPQEPQPKECAEERPPHLGGRGDEPKPQDVPPQRPQRHQPRRGPADPVRWVHLVIAVLMCGMGDAVKLYFKARRDETAMHDVERHALEKEIETLNYQINPHFFMNTLNNIHALIDIDPERAKSAIIELSKLLRYALYEGGTKMVPLRKELDFTSHYIRLMRLRYTDKVDIKEDLQASTADADAEIPPLLLVTFVENAFKHGVSYRQASFIHISATVEAGRIEFLCRNSVATVSTVNGGGVGLANVRKRLTLIYGENYSLDITPEAETFTVRLKIPQKI